MSTKKAILFFILPIVVSFALHWRVFSLDVMGFHVWRQAQTQTVTYTFSTEHNNILQPLRFDLHDGTREVLYEFPIYQWLVAQINRAIGYSVTHSRFFSFFCFVFFLLAFYNLSRLFFDTKFALLTNALLCFSPLLYYYCVNPMPDIMALCMGTWALYFFFLDRIKSTTLLFSYFLFFLSIATLIKLPYVLFGVVCLPYLRFKVLLYSLKKHWNRLLLIFVFAIAPVLWYARAIPTWRGNGITQGILGNNKTIWQWLDDLQFNLISSFPELLCNYGSCLFLFVGVFVFFKHKKWQSQRVAAFTCLFAVLFLYLLFELNMLGKTHDYYLMPFLVPMFLIVTFGLKLVYESAYKWYIVLALIAVPIIAFLRIDHRWNANELGYNRAFSDEQQTVQRLIPKTEKCIVSYDESRYIALYFFKRVGFTLSEGELSANNLNQLHNLGANYLVSIGNNVDTSTFDHHKMQLLYNNQLRVYKISEK